FCKPFVLIFIHRLGVWGIRSCLRWGISHASENTSHQVASHESQVISLLFRNQQVLSEWPLGVDPLPLAAESCSRRHLWDFLGLVLVRTLCPDRFIFVQHDAKARRRNVYRLPTGRAQMHFDAPLREIPERLVPEGSQIKIRAQLPVDA